MKPDAKILLEKAANVLSGNAFVTAKSHIRAAISEIIRIEKKKKKKKSQPVAGDQWKLDLNSGLLAHPTMTLSQQKLALQSIEDMIEQETKKMEKKSKDDDIHNREDVILD